MSGMGHHVATIALGPLLLVQGRYVRKRIPKLPEAPGPRSGTVGDGRLLRVLVAGDSAAAGVGAPSQDLALSGRLVSLLKERFRVEWRLEARTGATTEDTLNWLQELQGQRFDVLVTSLGVNDLTRGVGEERWLDSQSRLRTFAREGLGVGLSVIAGLPPVDGFPALPQPLRWYLGRRAKGFSRRLREDLRGDPDAEFLDLRFTLDPSLMARDGFHPGPVIYQGWGERAAALVIARWDGSPDSS